MTALAFGLVIVGMAYSIGRVSGCHVNPAVSMGVFCAGRMSFAEFIGYICAQVVGAILGAFVLFAIAGVGGTNAPADGVSVVSALALECILTFFFVLVILFVTADDKFERIAGVVIGLTLTLVHLVGIHFTGTSVNPARSFGPALVAALQGQAGALGVVWIFIVAPLVGGALAAVVYKALASK
jgi:aquaporin Z